MQTNFKFVKWIGNEVIQVVTGADNIKEQDIIQLLPGATLAGGIKISKGKLRGVVSEGMMCSIGSWIYQRRLSRCS